MTIYDALRKVFLRNDSQGDFTYCVINRHPIMRARVIMRARAASWRVWFTATGRPEIGLHAAGLHAAGLHASFCDGSIPCSAALSPIRQMEKCV